MKRILFLLLVVSSVFSCKKDDSNPAIEISGITCNDMAVEGDIIEIEVGKAAELKVTGTNAEIASCLWSVDDMVVEGVNNTTYTFTAQWSGDYKIKVSLKNHDDVVTEKTYTLQATGKYTNMPLLIRESDTGMSNGDVAVVMNGVMKDDQFSEVNNASIPVSVNDATVFGNNIYFLSTVDDFICEADLQTLKIKRKIKKTTPTQGKGTVRRMVVASKDKAYVTLYNPYNAKQGAILTVNLKEEKTEKVVDMEGIFDGEMLTIGDKVIFGAANKLQYINPKTDQMTLIKEFDASDVIKGVTQGKDGKLYVLIAIGTKSKMVCMNASSFAVETTVEMSAELGNTTALCASSKDNKLYYVSTGSGWASTSTVYCYNTDTQTASVFANPQKEMYGYMTISSDGSTLYFPWTANYNTSYGFIAYSSSNAGQTEYDFAGNATCKVIHK